MTNAHPHPTAKLFEINVGDGENTTFTIRHGLDENDLYHDAYDVTKTGAHQESMPHTWTPIDRDTAEIGFDRVWPAHSVRVYIRTEYRTDWEQVFTSSP